MIKVEYNNNLQIRDLIHTDQVYPIRVLKKISELNQIRFTAFDFTDEAIHLLLSDLVNVMLPEHNLYFVYVESSPQLQTRIRSHRKMFYAPLKEGQLKPNQVFEFESQVGDNKSLLTSLVRLEKSNVQYVLGNLINSNFRFAYAVKKGERSFTPNKQSFLEDVVENRIKGSKVTRLDMPNILISYVDVSKCIFRIKNSANSKKVVEIYLSNHDKAIRQKLSKIGSEFRAAMEN